MEITFELFFQLFNTLILLLIPGVLILIVGIVIFKSIKAKDRILELEKRINDLENK